LKPGAAGVAAKTPGCPGFDRPGGRGGTALLRAGQVAGARDAVAKGVNPALGRVQLACARAPVPRRAGRPDGEGVPSRVCGRGAGRPVQCESEAGERKVRIGVRG
jgi:hypothetical protein